MTYFTYEKLQCSDYKERREIPYTFTWNGKLVKNFWQEGIYRHREPPKKMPLVVPRPSFMPSYLVRTSDMKVVRGSEVHEGYCTLSYSWNQSGEIIKDGTGKNSYRRVDEGKHKIVFPARTVRKKPRGRKRIPRKVTFVKFEGLIQEICKDFNIKYIWYDQMCINQDDEDEKHREIRQMHKIYSNAYCKIALIPELEIFLSQSNHSNRFLRKTDLGSFMTCQWMKRMWTLEETVMSSRMLFVGRNIHMWWYCLPSYFFPIFFKEYDRNASRILHSAHTRTSTKEHDHIFALANVFPDVMEEIKIDYKQDIQELMLQFYGGLAQRDLSILCFGSYRHYKKIFKASPGSSIRNNGAKEAEYEVPVQKFDLPSWTGVDGEHYYYGCYKTSFKNYTVIGRAMQITCSGMTNNQHHSEISAFASIALEDLPPLPEQDINYDSAWRLGILVRPPGSTQDKRLILCNVCKVEHQLRNKGCEHASEQLRELSHFMPIKKENLQWIRSDSWISVASINSFDLTEVLRDSTQYILLTGVKFTYPESRRSFPRYPIIKKHRDHYKLMGLCNIKGDDYFLNGITLQEQMFEIY